MSAAEIKRNLRDLLAQIPGDPLVPTTTLTADVSAGDGTATIVPLLTSHGASRIRPESPLQFHDATGERATVQSVSSDGATLTFTAPLVHDHPTTQTMGGQSFDTKVYTNLIAFSRLEPGSMLVLGDAVICMSARRRRDNQDVQRGVFPLYSVELYYFRLFNKPADFAGTDLDWEEMQENACTDDLDRMATYLLKNQELIGPFTVAAAEKFGPLNSSNDLIDTTWDWVKAEEADTWLYTGCQRIAVVAPGFGV